MSRPFLLTDVDDASSTASSPTSDVGPNVQGFDHPGDAIPAQRVFATEAFRLINVIHETPTQSARYLAIATLLHFLLQPEVEMFHWAYPVWRLSMNRKCEEFLQCDPPPEIQILCNRLLTEYPA